MIRKILQFRRPDIPPALTLSFDYERGLAGDDPALADAGLDAVLAALARRRLSATFNCCAKLAELAPGRIRAIAAAGHEVACHGYSHESPRDLDDAGIRDMLRRSLDAFRALSIGPIGFRSPQSHWDKRLMRELAAGGFRYSAEHDRANRPYVITRQPRDLVRFPVRTDDWDYVRNPAAPEVVGRHTAYLRNAAAAKLPLALGYHPWVLAQDARRLRDWESLVDLALELQVPVAPFAGLLPS